MIKRSIASENGFALISASLVAGFIALIAYLVSPYFINQKKEILDMDVYSEAKFLSEDMLELGKYLLMYERNFYVDKEGPLKLVPGTERREKLLSVWSGDISEGDSLDLQKACGGYDAMGNFLGEFKLGGVPIFCPVYVRSSLFNGRFLESLYFERILSSDANLPFEKVKDGHYKLTLVFYDKENDLDLITKNDGYIAVNAGQRLLTSKKSWLDRVSVEFHFMTDSSGFTSGNSKRFVEIKSFVEIGEAMRRKRIVESRTSFSFATPTPKLFALFVPYPMKDDNTITNKFSEAIKIHPDSQVFGKVYFNGNIDLPLDQLPTFHETVILSGDFTPPLSLTDREKFLQKFKKGVVTKFSASRFLMSGKCSTDDVMIFNQAGFSCKHDDGTTKVTINDYITDISNQCTYLPLKFDQTKNEAKSTLDCGSGLDPRCTEDAPVGCRQTLISGVFEKVSLSGPYAFIFSTVSNVSSTASNVYGSILGGHLNFGPMAVKIKSQQQWKIGDPGIGSEEILKSWNDQANLANVGITVPLSNIPLVFLGE